MVKESEKRGNKGCSPALRGRRKMPIRLAELADIIGAEARGAAERMIGGAAAFDAAGPEDITFADSPKMLRRVEKSAAGAVIVPETFAGPAGAGLVHALNPRLAFARALHFFYPGQKARAGISARAVVGEAFICGQGSSVAANVVIGSDVTLGERVCLHPGVVLGDRVEIGDDTEIFPNVTILERCKIGRRVVIHSGTVIGSDGYGFVPDGEKHAKIPQLGVVQIDDDVEIGAVNSIDRATFGRTWIKSGVKTDNLVHIAHNVTVGENTLIVAQVGIAGSAAIGKNVTIAGQAGIGGHITLGDRVVVGPQAGVARSVQEGRVVSGTPEMPHRLWLKAQQLVARLPEMKKRLDRLERLVKEKMPGAAGAPPRGGEAEKTGGKGGGT